MTTNLVPKEWLVALAEQRTTGAEVHRVRNVLMVYRGAANASHCATKGELSELRDAFFLAEEQLRTIAFRQA